MSKDFVQPLHYYRAAREFLSELALGDREEESLPLNGEKPNSGSAPLSSTDKRMHL